MTRISSARRNLHRGRILLLVIALATVVVFSAASQAMATTFDPTKIISDDNMRASDSLKTADIQAFLATQKGPLKSLSFPRHDREATASASTIIFEACQAWHISPKVMLTMLQKEQSLLTRTTLVAGAHGTLDWAVGMGCPDGSARIETYRGFGNQMWYAAMRLDGYGEHKNGSTLALWKSPFTLYAGVKTANLATYKLYIYNPCIGAKAPYGDLSTQAANLSGNANFWMIYRKYFGDTFANPAKRPVYRFRDVKTGAYLYTASPAERYNLTRNARYRYETVAFSWDTSNTANNIPVYRFVNFKTRGYLFTASGSQATQLRSASKRKIWGYQGVAFEVSGKLASATPVYQFNNRKTGLPFLTTSKGDVKVFLSAANRKKWVYKGIPYYLAP